MVDDSTQTHGPDIGRQQLGAVYAKAFLGAMEKASATDQMMAELDALIREILDQYPGLDATLSSLRLSASELSVRMSMSVDPGLGSNTGMSSGMLFC